MATVKQWIEGARLRTWPNAIAPVLVGTGAATGVDLWSVPIAALALAVSLLLITGVNFANDYSDGIRGTDDDRVGPFRLVGSGAANPAAVRNAAFGCFGLAALAGIGVVVLSGQWWMLAVGALCIAGAWFYTGGKRPYGYAGLGEIAVFVFFGLVAVLGTMYAQAGTISGFGIGGAVGIGAFSSAVLVANNLRDIPTDRVTGKRTLAVLLGDRDTRTLYVSLVLIPFLITVLIGLRNTWALLGFLALPLLIGSVLAVTRGGTGRKLIPALRDTGLAMLVWGATTALALAFG
ncbi:MULTISPECIES: 1,4-dihydroxy-2-naphthoate polyprenyltransferase [Saccharopolyspora]|nr:MULTISPECIES: 1,4-dihydroxy-2-naphthoate polyprenyltransferase [Saccharopolyspora]MCA1187707.1 1,4-dihydroxy-2-naphthoate polyprenyltransferase [Saccharopolyspora sp. 6T]MCA1191038.1 1,4-dihydroxy-2-naphthoate polyprenyltransferase [Saccharopolyspora sp. 6V]MCA1278700.1 1,4-dihydroxy-2-naphthoate polyprenyltransferase [Saccharopolyspora sp. 7B]